MNLKFFNGAGMLAGEERLQMVNAAIRETGLQFDWYKLDGEPVYTFAELNEGMQSGPSSRGELTIAMLHFTECPDLARHIEVWNVDRRGATILLLFSGAGLGRAEVEPVIEAGGKAGLGGVLWLNQRLADAATSPKWRSFFDRLGKMPDLTTKFITDTFDDILGLHEDELGILAAISIYCQGYQIARRTSADTIRERVAKPTWWRLPLSRDQARRLAERENGGVLSLDVARLMEWIYGTETEVPLDELVSKALVALRT